MFVGASVWLCCLRPDDKAAVIATVALFTAELNQPIPEDVFSLVWGGTQTVMFGGADFPLDIYALEHTLIIIPDEPPIPAIGIVDPLLWLDIEGFVVSGGAACADGCDVPSFLLS